MLLSSAVHVVACEHRCISGRHFSLPEKCLSSGEPPTQSFFKGSSRVPALIERLRVSQEKRRPEIHLCSFHVSCDSHMASGNLSMRNEGAKSVLIYPDCCRLLCTNLVAFFHLRKFRKLLTEYFSFGIFYLVKARQFDCKGRF